MFAGRTIPECKGLRPLRLEPPSENRTEPDPIRLSRSAAGSREVSSVSSLASGGVAGPHDSPTPPFHLWRNEPGMDRTDRQSPSGCGFWLPASTGSRWNNGEVPNNSADSDAPLRDARIARHSAKPGSQERMVGQVCGRHRCDGHRSAIPSCRAWEAASRAPHRRAILPSSMTNHSMATNV